MTDKTKSGQEILDDFFSKITNIEGLDKQVTNIVLKLYKDGKLTNTNLSNELSNLREKPTK